MRIEDRLMIEVRSEIARLLATAYQRYRGIRRVGTDRTETSGNPELANSRTQSVHGGVE